MVVSQYTRFLERDVRQISIGFTLRRVGQRADAPFLRLLRTRFGKASANLSRSGNRAKGVCYQTKVHYHPSPGWDSDLKNHALSFD